MITARCDARAASAPAARQRSRSARVRPPRPRAPTRRKSRRAIPSQRGRRLSPQMVSMDQDSNLLADTTRTPVWKRLQTKNRVATGVVLEPLADQPTFLEQ